MAALLALAACANVRSVPSDVTSFSSWPAGRAPGSYAFERLPSQEGQPEQGELEQAARGPLAGAGFTEASPETAEFSVQLGARLSPYPAAYGGTSVGIGGGFGAVGRSTFSGVGIGLNFGGGPSAQAREVSIVIRDRRTTRTLYEARAQNDGAGAGNPRIDEAMFAAAMKDFPLAGVNPRRVVIEMP